jgi:hypothetical protein
VGEALASIFWAKVHYIPNKKTTYKLLKYNLISRMLQPTLKNRRSGMMAVLWGWL